MKQKTKNIIWIILWTTITSVLIISFIETFDKLWEKVLFVLLGAMNVMLYIININRIKYFAIIDENLIINQTFLKQKQYRLKKIISWTENHYQLLGIKTENEIILNIEGIKMKLFERNSKDYVKLSDYLNENLSTRYENNR